MEATQIPDEDFKINGCKNAQRPREWMDYLSENWNKEMVSIKRDIETIKNNHLERKDTISEEYTRGKHQQVRWSRKSYQQFTGKDNRKHLSRATKWKENFFLKNEEFLRDLWDDIKFTGTPEGKESKQKTGKLFKEIMAGPSLNWWRKNTHVQERQRV